MIKIGKSYIDKLKGEARLCSNITADKGNITIWFAVDVSQKEYLSVGRADAFVMALLPMAMRSGQNIVCEDVLSERLRYQLSEHLVPALALEEGGEFYRPIQIDAPLTVEKCQGIHGVGACFSDGDDFRYTVACHDSESEYPLTHTAVFHIDAAEDGRDREAFREKCRRAAAFSEDRNLQTICVDTNLGEELQEKTEEVSTFRKLACALALQGLFSVFLLPTEKDAADFRLNLKNCADYDLLTMTCASTESMAVYLSGAERKGKDRLRVLQEQKKFPEDFPAGGAAENGTCIKIGKPYMEQVSGAVRLCAQIVLHGEEKSMWIAFKSAYAPYLTMDRADAFVSTLLTTAMRDGTDIVCEAPVTRRLLYQINQYLIPMMSSNINGYHEIKVYAESTDAALDCCGAVVTGWTGGVDSMFTIWKNLQESEKSDYRLTYLMIASNGAIEGTEPSATLWKMVEKAEKGIGSELGMEIVGIDTNFRELLPESFLAVQEFRHAAVILAVQKLFGTYLISSSYSYANFSFSAEKVGLYEFIVLYYLGTENTVMYSSGGIYSRGKKLNELSGFPLAYKYLHPCIYALRDKNCGKCGKCIRTQVGLYAIGALEKFSQVFDIEDFKTHKNQNLANVIEYKDRNLDCAEAVELLHKQGKNLFLAKCVIFGRRMREKSKTLRSSFFKK